MRLQIDQVEKQMSDTITYKPDIVQGLQAHAEFIGVKGYHAQTWKWSL